MPIYCLLATEGPHDQAVITKLLTLSGFQSFGGDLNSLDPFWEGFIPVYPKKGKVYARLDMPSILLSFIIRNSWRYYRGTSSHRYLRIA